MEALAPDRVLGGRYRLRRELARGGMATVWEADDRVLSRRVAIKILHPHLASDDGFRVRFRREAIAAARLAHPNIVTTYDTGRDAEVAYIVMELVEGITLARLLKVSGPLPMDKAVDVAIQVADALACAHANGVIHRDVKPANILLRSDGHVKVADFGIAKAGAGADLTRTGVVMGTAKYLSPEQVSGNAADAGSDVYALGVVLYEMLAGQAPFVGETELSTAVARLTGSPDSLRNRRPDIPPSLEAVVLRSLARDPISRFRSAEEMRSGLLAVDLSGRETAVTPPAGVATAIEPARRSSARIATAAAIVAMLGAGAVLIRSDRPGDAPSRKRKSNVAAPARGRITPPDPLDAYAYDPLGGDGEENDQTVPLAVDGDPATAWKTENYKSPSFGGLKEGVGLYVDLGTSKPVRSVSVRSSHTGWTGEIYLSDSVPGSIDGWGEARAAGNGTFSVGGAKGRYLLLWLTTLPPTDGGYRLDVSEITIA